MNFNKQTIKTHIKKIRKEIGHEDSDINIIELKFKEDKKELWIIVPDRPDKSAIIGKGGWVVGRLKEELEINKIHVESYSDYILKKYQMELSLNAIDSFISKNPQNKNPLNNLKKLLELRINDIYEFDFNSYFKTIDDNHEKKQIEKNHQAIVAISGGVDSSFSLILAKYLGFNPIAITVDPGTIILPNQFRINIDNLCKKLKVKHEYLKADSKEVIENALAGRFHPCGRCSNIIEETLFKYAIKHNINIVIFGDMLSTGSQCITKHKADCTELNNNYKSKNEYNTLNSYQNHELSELYRLNLPATLSIGKEEIKNTTKYFNIKSIPGFGCPLLFEVHKKYPHMKKFSIQRILRETRSGALEPGQALDLIWSFYKKS
ncbi:hypothetical protein MBCUT_17280 [Methanobrevibacter cuticularis]|uniref:ATPase n=1 Tax=Methanobrevibacter cuticularis TaxID=47311 RepID=A0A166D1F8_9EURY|nr:ATPase [Methanobrevibacter cuticularis]KZX15105.1 hypothetical protein MBCUT_17280 [Methanobrevibacter cuticularis]